MNIIYETLKSIGADFNSPASDRNLGFHEARLGVSLPNALKRFYMQSDGIKAPLGACYWNWWPLDTLVTVDCFLMRENIREVLPAYLDDKALRKSVVFCDALFCMPSYAVLLDECSEFAGTVYALNPHYHVASSVDEFGGLFSRQYENALLDPNPSGSTWPQPKSGNRG